MPYRLTQIQVAFQKDEKLVHSVRFIGDSVLEIGQVDTTYENRRKARIETYIIKKDETFLGCEIYSNSDD